MHEPIAIIGIGCRFPGGVTNPETFWKLLMDEVDAITEIPASRFDLNAYYDATPATPGKVMSRWGGYLDKIDEFDAGFFGISPREAERLDPQQRLLLEVAWEALEDAGELPDTQANQQTGVFVGQWLSDFEARLFRDPSKVDFYMTTGSGRYSSSGRLSYILGFQGPSLTVDTACSSSLVAVHLAAQSLRNNECRMALAGAANVILQPQITIAYSQSKMMAPDGHCKFGDALADGYVRSEGAAMIALKRLTDAVADGDPIYAVIRGSAINNDGKTSGYMATPGAAGQEEMLRKAYADAEVSPGAAQYVEAHGTGTNAGDPVEIGALGAVLAEGRPGGQHCMIGSIKTNFGHTEGAAGMAGLIKVALSLKHQTIPASLHFHNPSPKIPWDQLPVRVQAKSTPWPEHEGAAIGGVSAFGIAGTNAHVVLEEYFTPPQPLPIAKADGEGQKNVKEEGEHDGSSLQDQAILLPISAQTDEALKALAERYQKAIEDDNLADVAYTAATRRVHHQRRLAVVARSGVEMREKLGAFVKGETQRGIAASGDTAYNTRKIVFVFPGQGGQWVGMGRQLLEQEPAFRDMMEQCQEAMRPYVDWTLIDELQSGARVEEIEVVQPMIFAVQVSLAAVWRLWGIEPEAVIGHSMGEVAGAYVAGVLSLEDAAHVICRRSQLMKQVSGKGAMAVVELTFDEAQAAIAGYEDRLGIAVSNGPRSTVLSGDPTVLETVLEGLRKKEIFCRPVKVDVAAHSPHMEPLRPGLVKDLEGLKALETPIPVYSTVTGALQDSTQFDADYWGQNLRQPVLFAAAVQQALNDGYNTFIEMNPHPILLAAVEQSFKAQGLEDGLTLSSTRREEDEAAGLRESLGKLYAAGYTVDWTQVYPSGHVLRLPTYPWQRERYWVAEAELDSGSGQAIRRAGAHLMLGQYFKTHSGTHYWETRLDLEAFPYLSDHRVQGKVIFPAAGYVELALAAANEAFGAGAHTLEPIEYREALFLPETGAQIIQIILAPEMPGRASFHCFSRAANDEQTWTLHANGMVRIGEAEVHPEFEAPSAMEKRMPHYLTSEMHYQAMDARRLNYGTAFQGVDHVWRNSTEALAELRLVDGVQPGGYQLHPAVLDAAFQVLLDMLGEESANDTYLPVTLKSLRAYGRPDAEAGLWAYARVDEPHPLAPSPQAEKGNQDGILEGDVLLLDRAGQVVMVAEGLRMQRLERSTEDVNTWLYDVQWVEINALAEAAKPKEAGNWLMLADRGGSGADLAARLEAMGENVILVTAGDRFAATDAEHYVVNPAAGDDFKELMRQVSDVGLRGVVHLWNTGISQEIDLDSLHQAEALGAISALHLTQALSAVGLSPRVWLVTRDGSIQGAALWGFGATLANEHPELHPTRISWSAADGAEALFRELWEEGEDQIRLHEGKRYAARLAQHEAIPVQATIEQKIVSPDEQEFRVEVTTPGILDGLKARAMTRREPNAGEVEIEVHATGLNFMNVMSALGIYPGYPKGVGPIGIECAGRILSVGEGVRGWAVGDEVVAVAYDSLATHAITDARLMAKKPLHLSFEEAATIPIVFLTAHYALNHLAAMQSGERVLIHSATGGVGLAAIQLARLAGADIWATAGTPEKRAYLHEMGIEHVLDSRTLDFGDAILQETHGEGVDVVLNSLAGDAIGRGLAILRPYGRFLEIGKRDIYQNMQVGLLPFQNSLSYFAIDLDRMMRERPALIGGMLQEIMAWVEQGDLHPIPMEVFPVSQAVEAFRHIAQAKHIGKVVINLREEQVPVELGATALIREEGSYLITGGLGGLGLAVAQWLGGQGARQIVLVGRSAPSEAAQVVIQGLEAAGVAVQVAQVDVSDQDAVRGLIAEIGNHWNPLRGVFHAAGVLADSTIDQMDDERFRGAMKPKMDGAWNLHEATQNCELDHFVLFSSVAALLGLAGQSNYAAGNAFMDSLAHYRWANGLAALSINWGPWSDVGLAAEQANRGERLASRGLGSIAPEEGIAILEGLMREATTQVAVMDFDAEQWAETYSTARNSSLLANLLQAQDKAAANANESAEQADDLRTALLAAEPGRARRSLLENHIKEQVARVLGLAASRIDVQKPLRNMGIDSLMTLELRNRLESSAKLSLPATLVFNYPTVAALTGHLAEKLGVPLDAAKAEVKAEAAEAKVDELENLSRDEVEAMLADELKSLDELLKGGD